MQAGRPAATHLIHGRQIKIKHHLRFIPEVQLVLHLPEARRKTVGTKTDVHRVVPILVTMTLDGVRRLQVVHGKNQPVEPVPVVLLRRAAKKAVAAGEPARSRAGQLRLRRRNRIRINLAAADGMFRLQKLIKLVEPRRNRPHPVGVVARRRRTVGAQAIQAAPQ